MRADSLGGRGPLYGATNQAFNSDDVLTGRHYKQPALLEIFEEPPPLAAVAEAVAAADDNIIADDARGDERESWDSKITFLLATIGSVCGRIPIFKSLTYKVFQLCCWSGECLAFSLLGTEERWWSLSRPILYHAVPARAAHLLS